MMHWFRKYDVTPLRSAMMQTSFKKRTFVTRQKCAFCCEKTTKRSKNEVRTTKSSVVARLDNLEFGGQWPLTMRARCRAFRYCPDPLGIVTAEVLVKLEFT